MIIRYSWSDLVEIVESPAWIRCVVHILNGSLCPRPELNLFLFDLLPWTLAWSQHTASWWRAQLLCSCFAHVNCLLISSLTVFLQMNFSFTIWHFCWARVVEWCAQKFLPCFFSADASLTSDKNPDYVFLLDSTPCSLSIICSIMFNMTVCWFASWSASVWFSSRSRN